MARFGRRFPVRPHITARRAVPAFVSRADSAAAAELATLSAALPGADTASATDVVSAAGEAVSGADSASAAENVSVQLPQAIVSADAAQAGDVVSAAGEAVRSADFAFHSRSMATVAYVYSASRWISV